MSYGKKRKLSDSDESSCCVLTEELIPLECDSPIAEPSHIKDSISQRVRQTFNSIYSMATMPYKFFTSKREKKSTDVFVASSQQADNRSQTNSTPKFSFSKGANSRTEYIPFNNNRKFNPMRCKVCLHVLTNERRCTNCKHISSMNSSSFYGKSRSHADCIDIDADDEIRTFKLIANENKSPVIVLGDSAPVGEVIECVGSEQSEVSAENISPSSETLKTKKVHFGTYSCSIKGFQVFKDRLKFSNVPQMNSDKFKLHITIPTSELIEISSCISNVETSLLLRTDPSSTNKIREALNLNDGKSGHYYSPDEEGGKARYIIVVLQSLPLHIWKCLEEIIEQDRILHRKMTFTDVHNLVLQTERYLKTNEETAYAPTVVKRKVPRFSTPKTKQVKVNTVIELDDSCDAESVSASSSNDIILNYPPDEVDSITISEYDMSCLGEEQFLNDSILGFYLKYIQKNLTDESIASKIYIFNTFFYGKLSKSRKNEDMSKSVAERVYDRVKNWTKCVDIFEKDFLIIPMNKNYHWFLAIVCFPKLVSEDSKSSWQHICKREHNPCIVYMDSLGIARERPRLSEPIRHFLSMEWQKKKGSQVTFAKAVLPDHYPRVPYQTNSTDCGLFVLQYVEQFLKDPNFVLNNLASVKLEEWFPLSVIDAKRSHLRSLIEQLRDESKFLKMEVCDSETSNVDSVDTQEVAEKDLESPIPSVDTVLVSSAEKND